MMRTLLFTCLRAKLHIVRQKVTFGKRDFIYKAETDEYECPAGQRAIYRFTTQEKGKPSSVTGRLPVLTVQ